MAGGNANNINRPRTSLRRSLSRLGRVRSSQKKKQESQRTKRVVVVDVLTPIQIRKKRRTNPHANITLSGKKKRLLLKEIKRNKKEMAAMEVVPEQTDTKTEQEKPRERKKLEGMDTS